MHAEVYPWLRSDWGQYNKSTSNNADILLHAKQERMETTHRSTLARKRVDNSERFVIFIAFLSALLVVFLKIGTPVPSLSVLEEVGLRFSYCGSHGREKGAPFAPKDIQKLWGYLAPYYSLTAYENPPPDCTITQVNILHRHGARQPETPDYIAMKSAVDKIQLAQDFKGDKLKFLNDYTYDLVAEHLVDFGAEQSWISGYFAYEHYGHLIDVENMPFLRAGLCNRVINSAQNWSAGFYQRSGSRYRPNISVLIPEGEHDNNTLFNNNCPNAIGPFKQLKEWVDIYATPIADRLNAMSIGLSKNITTLDAFYLMMMCPFETIYHEKYSNFCRLFSKAEFEGFEYALDLEQYYKTGYGQVQDLGRAQGVGYVNELLARLTNSPVKDNTQTNHTLDDNPKTFPLDRKMYADFGHDHAMVAVYSAMGLFNYSKLDPSNPDPDREWVVSRIVPFSGRMSVERLECKPKPSSWWMGHTKVWKRNGEYVRVLVNDAIRPLAFCGGDEDGLCELGRFVESQEYARVDGQREFTRCGYEPHV